jgi:hypothetical protein
MTTYRRRYRCCAAFRVGAVHTGAPGNQPPRDLLLPSGSRTNQRGLASPGRLIEKRLTLGATRDALVHEVQYLEVPLAAGLHDKTP